VRRRWSTAASGRVAPAASSPRRRQPGLPPTPAARLLGEVRPAGCVGRRWRVDGREDTRDAPQERAQPPTGGVGGTHAVLEVLGRRAAGRVVPNCENAWRGRGGQHNTSRVPTAVV
jgi:hypothetical protein